MNGLLIYNKIDIERNSWFIDELIKEFSFRNINLSLVKEDEIDFRNIDCNFAIYRGRDYRIVKKLQNLGVIVFNNDLVSKIANDKYESYKFLKKNKILCLKTYNKFEDINEFPVVVKTRNGHGGQEVFLCKNPLELSDIQKNYDNLIYQPYAKYANQDLRAYLLGNDVIATILRTSNDDFRSNFSLGGEVKNVTAPKEVIKICKKIRRIIKSDFIGIDFFYDGKNYLVNEIEDPVGCRMLYKTTDINIIKDFVDYCKERL